MDRYLGSFKRSKTPEERNKPLRSFKEMCAELKVPEKSMQGYLGKYDGPAPVLNAQGTVRNRWYNPDEFRAWWKQTKPKIEKQHAHQP